MNIDEKFMREALKEARKAFDIGEVPIGAVIVRDNKIIARAYNEKELKQDVTKHAEIMVIQKASKKLKNWRLNDYTIYVTLKPCSMCEGAIIQSRIKNIVIGTDYEQLGAVESHLNCNNKIGEYINIKIGVMETECREILKDFFNSVRKNKNIKL